MITWIIIGITCVVSFLAFQNHEMMLKMRFNAAMVVQRREYYRLITHAFVHADWNHLLFNMISLFFFGPVLERELQYYFGNMSVVYFLVLYFGGMLISNIWALMKYKNDYSYNAVGASGAVSSVIFAFIFFEPLERIILLVLPMPGIVFAVGYLAYSYYMGKKSRDNVAHDAHFLGSVFGFVFPVLLKPSLLPLFIEKLMSFF